VRKTRTRPKHRSPNPQKLQRERLLPVDPGARGVGGGQPVGDRAPRRSARDGHPRGPPGSHRRLSGGREQRWAKSSSSKIAPDSSLMASHVGRALRECCFGDPGGFSSGMGSTKWGCRHMLSVTSGGAGLRVRASLCICAGGFASSIEIAPEPENGGRSRRLTESRYLICILSGTLRHLTSHLSYLR
jgi:hypothetical protein